MKIYTGRGDTGLTSLFSGQRVGKDALRVEAYGTLDELNSILGSALAFSQNAEVIGILEDLQNKLFRSGSDLATITGERVRRLGEQDWRGLETTIDRLESDLPPLKNFILPGGSPVASLIQVGRSVCRRAERLAVRLVNQEGDVNPHLIVYLNRLSDLLFVLGRYENLKEGGKETLWKEEA